MEIQTDTSSLIHRIGEVVRPNLKFQDSSAPIPAEADLGELGLDSLASINLLLDLETEFNIQIPDDQLDENTFSSLANLEALVRASMAG